MDDIKALVATFNIKMTYKSDKEKAAFQVALNRFLPIYLEKEKGWTAEDWKKMLGFT
jgi:hypothetical protein